MEARGSAGNLPGVLAWRVPTYYRLWAGEFGDVDAQSQISHYDAVRQRRPTRTMTKTFITPEEGAELKQLEQDYLDAHRRARDAVVTEGMSSEAYLKADAETARIMRRIKEIRGTSGKHWMA